jgi:hypothetical protein
MYDSVEVVEIYPKILVYKNVYKDVQKNIKTLVESENNNEDRAFSQWTKWSIFGEYLSPVLPLDPEGIVKNTENKKDQVELFEEVISVFYYVTKDYCNKNNLPIFNEIDTKIKNYEGVMVDKWEMSGPTICKYHISDDENLYRMRYHSDYQREKADTPGYQFEVTALTYFNDDYQGGEIDFCIGKKLIKYKPEAGDVVVFPSGSPYFLTEDGIVYLHGVMPATGKNKYLSRMYWRLYQDASPKWIENESKFGKEVWLGMQSEIEKEYHSLYPQRIEIEGGIRIK